MTDQEIEDKLLDTIHRVWDKGESFVPLSWTHCSRCSDFRRDVKTKCISILTTGESLCAHCFAKMRIEEMRRERDAEARRRLAIEEERKKLDETAKSVVRQLTNEPPSSWRKPKLDVADFSRL